MHIHMRDGQVINGLLLNLCASLALTGAAFGATDPSPLELKSLQFAPTAIDTGAGDAEVTVSISSNAGSTVTYFETSFLDPSGVFRRSAATKVSANQSGTASVKVTFPKFSSSGTWTLSGAFVIDSKGNTLTLDTAELVGQGFQTRLTVT